MSRPRDGRCAHCHRPLPREEIRGWMTQGTDMCNKCGHARLQKAEKAPPARAYLKNWWQVLDSHLRVVAGVK